jgi:hypothetical protein
MIDRSIVGQTLAAIFRRLWRVVARYRTQAGFWFQAVALVFLGLALWSNVREFDLQDIQVDYAVVLAIMACVFVVVLLGALSWGLLALLFDFEGPWLWHVRAHLTANIAKYLPGSVWGYFSKGALSAQVGVPTTKVVGALILEMGLALASGIVLILSTGWSMANGSRLSNPISPVVWYGLGGLTVVLTCLSGRLIIARTAPPVCQSSRREIKALGLLLSTLATFALGWILLALSLSWMPNAIHFEAETSFARYIFALCAAMVAGILFIFVPYGIGVREGVLVLLLGDLFPLPVALLFAVASRVVIIIGELVAFLLSAGLFRLYNR